MHVPRVVRASTRTVMGTVKKRRMSSIKIKQGGPLINRTRVKGSTMQQQPNQSQSIVALLPQLPQKNLGYSEMQPVTGEVQRLHILLAIFKNRNMELVGEVGILRKELESLKQQLVLMQNTSNDPSTIMRVLNEMTNLSVGPPLESIILAAASQNDGTHPSLLQVEEQRNREANSFSHRGAEFAAELDRMPTLPGITSPMKKVDVHPEVTTVVFENIQQPGTVPSSSMGLEHAQPTEFSGCIFNQ